jgi:hypothetical protein
MTLIEKMEKDKRVLQRRIHTLQNWKGRLHRLDREELIRDIRALEDIEKTLGKLKATEVGNDIPTTP